MSTASPPTTVDSDILRALGPVAQSLARQGVQWHVGGSVASCIWGEGAHDVASFARRRPWQAGPGKDYSVASPEDTVVHKLRWCRLGGHVADRQWRDVVGVLIVQSGELEQEYMRRHATELGIDDLLSRAEREAASIDS